MELTAHIESMEDTAIDFSFKGRHNWFLMERVSADDTIMRYILYAFVIYVEDNGWMMKLLSEDDSIPNTNCPVYLLKQSTFKDPSAMAWRHMIMQMDSDRKLEQASISLEKTATCICRHKVEKSRAESEETVGSTPIDH